MIGFNNQQYIDSQSAHIKERISHFGNKLYLELGGKLFDDHHASRVLPGFQPDSKLQMLSQLRDQLEILIVISAADIERNKVRQDLGITYDEDVLRLRSAFVARGFYVSSVVITHYHGQRSADLFRRRLESLGIPSYVHYLIDGYPNNVDLICSSEGFGKNDYVPTTRPLVVVTAPGPGSGKMAVCLSQLYNEHTHGVQAGYAKFETFPVWNLPLSHPVNVAYEAATADLNDVNMIDPFHLETYGSVAINYNRDIEIFPVLRSLFTGIYGSCPYASPTDMGVNRVGFCISDDAACAEASRQEVIRRYFTALEHLAHGADCEAEVAKIATLMRQLAITVDDRPVVPAARERALATQNDAAALQLPDGTIVTGHTSELLGCSAALLINAAKHLAGIPKSELLIPEHLIRPITRTKVEILGAGNPRLHTDEVIVALSVCSDTNPYCRQVLAQLPNLAGSQVHATVYLSEVDRKTFSRLGCSLTCAPIK